MKISAILAAVFGLILMVYGWYFERFEVFQSMFWGFIFILLGFLLYCFIDIEEQFPSIEDYVD